MRSVLIVRRAVLLAGISLACTAPRPAQAQELDPRWLSWLGCWERLDTEPQPARRVACIVPADSGAAAVDVVAIVDGRVINGERIDASGAERAIAAEGCTGSERGTWSADGARWYRTAAIECQGGVSQGISQLYAMLPDGSWLDIQGVELPGGTGLRVLHYREASSLDGIPEAVTARLAGLEGINRPQSTAAQAEVTTGVVAEASRHLQPPVLQVWLAERNLGFTLNARELQALASAGVPGEVIDVMVALSFPRAFRLGRDLQVTDVRAGAQSAGIATGSMVRYDAATALYVCNPWVDSFQLYLAYRDRYCSLQPSSYGYGYPTWGEWRWGYMPLIVSADGSTIVGAGKAPAPRAHGRVAASGYQQDPGVTSSRQAQPRDGSTSAGNSTANTEQAAQPSGSSTGSSPAPTQEPQRTAKPRP